MITNRAALRADLADQCACGGPAGGWGRMVPGSTEGPAAL